MQDSITTPVTLSVSLDFAKIPLMVYAITQSLTILVFLVTVLSPQITDLTLVHALLPTLAIVCLVMTPVALFIGLVSVFAVVAVAVGICVAIVFLVVWIANVVYEFWNKWRKPRYDGPH